MKLLGLDAKAAEREKGAAERAHKRRMKVCELGLHRKGVGEVLSQATSARSDMRAQDL